MNPTKQPKITVAELIVVLKGFPPETEVLVYDDSILRQPEPKMERFATEVVTM